ncbi:hypothetical protein AA309_17455 [Microvirga vignae]|uniref:Uncharacterized protein n=1 Tax=Microvirga vignae TaxID=1225564 RepID=A0A0H1RH24_9HYPH|nr:hypothetical protein AA309_17455 [Microvirga vignae]
MDIMAGSDVVSRRLQDIFRLTPTLLIGSGFSCAYDLPHMGALGDHLITTLGSKLVTHEPKDLWTSALSDIRANLEKGLNAIPIGAAGRDEIIRLLREETASLIIQRTTEAEARILSSDNPETHAPARLLRRLYEGAPQNAPCISVITTNYDTLLELFCDLASLPLDTGFEGFRRRRVREHTLFQTHYTRSIATDRKRGSTYEHRPKPTVRLIKPHGSITWLTTEAGPIEVVNDQSTAARAIVVPGPSKYEDALINTLFDRVRGEMNVTLSQTQALVCIGFGFNDEHLQGIIRGRLDAGMPAVIITRDLTDAAQAIVNKHPHVLAFCRDGDGAVCYYDGNVCRFSAPIWQLDPFLRQFLE